MSRIDELLALHASFTALLERQGVTEDDFQSWFEGNALVFQLLGFKQAIPRPKLKLRGDQYFEPDFLVQDYRGVWHIFELKRPDTVLLKNPKRRTDLRAEFSTYVQQCREYADFFLEEAHRQQVENDYGARVQRTVPGLIIASTDEATDRTVLHELLVDRGNKVVVQTYTGVRDSIGMEIDHLESETVSLPGISVAMLGAFPDKPAVGDQVIVDFGSHPNRNRLTVRLANDTFHLELRDADGRPHTLSFRRPLVVEFANAIDLQLLELEFGVSRSGCYMAAWLNRRCLARQMTDLALVQDTSFHDWVLGSDMFGRTAVDFVLVEAVFYCRTLSWRERQQLHRHFDEVYSYYLNPLSAHSPNRITLRGKANFASPRHPTHPNAAPDAPRDAPKDRAGPWVWLNATHISLANGAAPVHDPRLGSETIPLPGLDESEWNRLIKRP